jgi:hypothetical protein
MAIEKRLMQANVPVCMSIPDEMVHNVKKVLLGDYDPGYFGQRLKILDIGANAGSFTLWANMR